MCGGAHARLRRGDEEFEARLYAELDAVQAIYCELSPQQMGRFDEILRELERFLAHCARCLGRYGPEWQLFAAVACAWLVSLVTLVWVRIVILWLLFHLLSRDGFT